MLVSQPASDPASIRLDSIRFDRRLDMQTAATALWPLMLAWQHAQGDYVSLPYRCDEMWHEQTIPLLDVRTTHIQLCEGVDQYFAPLTFGGPRRTRPLSAPGAVLWADLDEVDPHTLDGSLGVPRPSVAWLTSKGRYQCMWLLSRCIDVDLIETINMQVASRIGADPTGWDRTQLLRVPGSWHHKSEPQPGHLLWAEADRIDPDSLRHLMGHADGDVAQQVRTALLPPVDEVMALLEHVPLSITTQRLLRSRSTAAADRSERLFELASRLVHEAPQLTPAQIVTILKQSIWNKYRNRSDEIERLMRTVDVALLRSESREEEESYSSSLILNRGGEFSDQHIREGKGTLYLRYEDRDIECTSDTELLRIEAPEHRWLVPGWWPAGAQGLVAGGAKAFKSTLLSELVVSVASQAPFLGVSPTFQGTVLVVQEENRPEMLAGLQRRVRRSKGLPDDPLPIHWANQQGFVLSDRRDQALLRALIERTEPVLVVLDPLYLMLGDTNEDSNSEMRSILRFLTQLRAESEAALVIVHHYRKPSPMGGPMRAGSMVRGASAFHAWIEAAWYVQRTSDQDPTVRIQREFRWEDNSPAVDVLFEQTDALYCSTVFGEDPIGLSHDHTMLLDVLRKAAGRYVRNDLAQFMRDRHNWGTKRFARRVSELRDRSLVAITNTQGGKGVKAIVELTQT
jgi:hypothetical protein